MQSGNQNSVRGLLAGLAVFAAVLVLTLLSHRPPAPKPADALAEGQRAERWNLRQGKTYRTFGKTSPK